MFEKIKELLMDFFNLFKTQKGIEEVLGIKTALSEEMYNKIVLWQQMLRGAAPWNTKELTPCGILNQVAGKLNHMVSREIGVEVENEAIKKCMEKLDKDAGIITEYITTLGGALLRPIFANGKLQYELLPLGNYIPVKYDFDGTLTSAIILKGITTGKNKYILIEQHDFINKTHFVKCRLFKDSLGTLREVPLTAIQETAELTPEYYWENVNEPLIVEFRNESMNKVDGSQVPVALIAGCENLIREADEQWDRMNWEQEGGQLRVFADSDMFKKTNAKGERKPQLTPDLKKLIVEVEGNGITDGQRITEHAPALRTTAQNEMLQQIFRRIELSMNIGKGSVSDMESVQQTASQYNGGRQDFFAIVDFIEDEIANKYQAAADVFAHMAAAYGLGNNNSKISIFWNEDTTRKDITAAKQLALQEIAQGIKDKWEYRQEFYGEDEETAKAKVPAQEITNDFFEWPKEEPEEEPKKEE